MPASFKATEEILKVVFDTLDEEHLIDGLDHVEEENRVAIYDYLCEKIDEIIERRML
jgi:hypothetical protein